MQVKLSNKQICLKNTIWLIVQSHRRVNGADSFEGNISFKCEFSEVNKTGNK